MEKLKLTRSQSKCLNKVLSRKLENQTASHQWDGTGVQPLSGEIFLRFTEQPKIQLSLIMENKCVSRLLFY